MTTQTATRPVLIVHIPTPADAPPTLNRLIRDRWGHYRQKWLRICDKEVWAARVMQKQQHRPALKRARLTVTVYYCGKEPDTTNLAGVAKITEDALVRTHVLVDDSPAHLTTTVEAVRVAHMRERAIVLKVWEVE